MTLLLILCPIPPNPPPPDLPDLAPWPGSQPERFLLQEVPQVLQELGRPEGHRRAQEEGGA